MALTHALSTNNYGTAAKIVATSAANGTHTTLTAAMADSSVGETIFLRDSVTEDVTLTAGVNIACWNGRNLNTPSITGKLTMTTAGTCNISGIKLITNSDNFLAVTGSAASIVTLTNCFLSCTNNTGITFSSSSSSAQIILNNCAADCTTTGISLFSHSSSGTMFVRYLTHSNTGGTSTASTISAGAMNILNSNFTIPITTSGTATFIANNSYFDTSSVNATALTFGGSGGHSLANSRADSGTAVAISCGSATPIVSNCAVTSSNTNAISGSGTLTYSPVSFLGSSSTVNTSTQTPLQIGPRIYTNGGISFDSGTNLLANYVGTTSWTPSLTFGGGSTGITYTSQVGRYVRIGPLVFIQFNLLLSNKGSSTGNASLEGLPFTILNTTGITTPFSILWATIDLSASYTAVVMVPTINTTKCNINQAGDNVVQAVLQETAFANTSLISGGGWFFTA